jgi:acetyl-CoA carboxylase carboxyl transferase alpha subunit/acetyl-CoA carboxylase carboxyl transferase beta subunit
VTEILPRPLEKHQDWKICMKCRGPVYVKALNRNLGVCPECGAHHRVLAIDRIGQLLDEGSTKVIDWQPADADPLNFVDAMPYRDRLAAARRSTGLTEAMVLARGAILGNPVVAAVMDFGFLGGSLGIAVGSMIDLAADIALDERTPLLFVTASGGARMQEGVLSLMQMAKTSQALGRLDRAGVLTLSVITDPTYGGVAASFATLCDVIIAEPGARMGFAGPRVIEQTIRQTLPSGFQTAEFLVERGLIDAIRPRRALRPTLARLLALARPAEPGTARPPDTRARPNDLLHDPDRLPERPIWDVVSLARRLDRPTTIDYLNGAFDEFEELHGDRLGGDCRAIVGGLARVGGLPVVVIGTQKGHAAAELTAHNYGMPSPSGYRKAIRLMRLAEKLRLPVVTLIDTPGAHPGIAAEEQGQAIAVAESIQLMAGLSVPIVAVITGEGGSGGALALAVGDRVLACSNAVYSVISPEGCAAILWKDRRMAPVAAEALRMAAADLLRLGIVDGVLLEPGEGAHTDHRESAERLRDAVAACVLELSGLDRHELVAARQRRFRGYGMDAATELEPLADGRRDVDTRA